MNPIALIIESLLDEHRDAGTHSNPELANNIANALITASWEQLAAVTGGTVEHDHDGQTILHTGYFAPPVCRPFFAGGTKTLKDMERAVNPEELADV